MVLVLWPRAYVVQIGDSRCYHLRPPTLSQVTKDQTLAQEMIDQGLLPAGSAERSPLSHKADSAKEACTWLIDAALRDGGSDNVTVVVTRLLSSSPSEGESIRDTVLSMRKPRG